MIITVNKKRMKRNIPLAILASMPLTTLRAQDVYKTDVQTVTTDSVQTINGQHIDDIVVTKKRKGISRVGGAVNGQLINKDELFKAA